MGRTLSELIQSETGTSLWTREDWARLGRGELALSEEVAILADGYEAIME